MDTTCLVLLVLLQPVGSLLTDHCTSVRAFDFRNFVYPLNEPRFTNGKVLRLKVVDGRYDEVRPPEGVYGALYFNVDDVAFGDLTGDRVEDAAIVGIYGSNSGNFHVTDTYVLS